MILADLKKTRIVFLVVERDILVYIIACMMRSLY